MPLTKAEKNLKTLMQVWMIMLLGAGVIFLTQGNLLLMKLNDLSAVYTPSLPLLPLPQEKFWLTLTTSLMVVLISMCYMVQKDVRNTLAIVELFLISKFTSTLFFVIFFITDKHALAYAIGVFTDGAMFLVTYGFFRKIKKLPNN